MEFTVKIGDSIWNFGGQPQEIIGETSRSWLLGPEWNKTKVPKKLDPNDFWPQWFFTEAEAQDAMFVRQHHYAIAKEVEELRRPKDAAKLRQVAELVGWKP